jgi:sortase A
LKDETRKSQKLKKRRSRTWILYLIVALMLISGISIMGYPWFSNFWNQMHQSRAIISYNQAVDELDQEEVQAQYDGAKAYNDQHTVNQIVDAFNKEEPYILSHPYDTLLNPDQDEIMGYIEIPLIHVKLPIYHGVSEATLQVGIGHVEGTSLPIGGEGTHAVLAGHRGLPSAKLFSNLDQLGVGDKFYLKVLNQTLAYEVDQIKVVLPTETSLLEIEEGKDLVTLLTCTPYGINTHRLLVRGRRIPYQEKVEQKEETTNLGDQAAQINPVHALIVGGLILFWAIILLILLIRRAKERKNRQDEEA